MAIGKILSAALSLITFGYFMIGASARPHPSPAAAAASLPQAGDLPSFLPIPDELKLNELYGAPANDFSCRSDRNAVVMLHGLSANRDVDLNQLQYELNRRGYCTFSLTYGAWPIPSWIGGLRHLADSAQEIADFIREVKEKTGAAKVDIVGHSEGGVQALYVPLTQDGISDIIEHLVALGPAIHGARYYGFADLWYIGGDVTRALAKPFAEAIYCPACEDLVKDGATYNEFQNAKKIVQEGTKATIIISASDTLVTPEASRINEPRVRNVIVQDTCPDDKVGHAGLAWDKSVWRLIVNALEENDEEVWPCEQGLPI